ncbi:MAG: hypothetical protein Q7T87_14375 [Polaromonas sp.]|nr:hypothetical protein [Polaromonas sp.]
MPLPLLIPAALATATLTLRSDTQPVKVYVRKPRGTLYWGGAGLNGDYILPTLQALQSAGIQHVNVGLNNSASRVLTSGPGTMLDAVRAGLVIRFRDDAEWTIGSGMASQGKQFNLIGYSYGSLLAAQTANFYARCGHKVDHLVLIASPIDRDFLRDLQTHSCIGKVVVIDLTDQGDHLHAGITQLELLRPEGLAKLGKDMLQAQGRGHFYYGHAVPDLPRRLERLAQRIAAEGLS